MMVVIVRADLFWKHAKKQVPDRSGEANSSGAGTQENPTGGGSGDGNPITRW